MERKRQNGQRTGIELLAPARNLEYGRVALDFGADAVYIGGPAFGARSAVPNSMEDIGALARYAHRFGAKVYMAINTLLYDSELEKAERLARQAWEQGVDALIVQDMAFMEMDLPPIPLHASTQTFNLDPEKIAFLGKAGFSRVVVERAAGLQDIRKIWQTTAMELEAFVHGAICVCYSGQCYMSHALGGKSGNRGECLQPCRWDYDLFHEAERILRGKHLLSVQDLNLTEKIGEMIAAGVTSFKIEGRVKDVAYLKNTVTHYRREIDRIIGGDAELCRTSVGRSEPGFTPEPVKTFSRGFTSYYLDDRRNRVASFDSPKSVGEPLGKVGQVGRDYFILDREAAVGNGDGLCFVGADGVMAGTNVNRIEGNRIYPNRMDGIRPGVFISRNHDHAFVRTVEKSACRRTIRVDGEFRTDRNSAVLVLRDEEGFVTKASAKGFYEIAAKPEQMEDHIRKNLKKMGDSYFRMGDLSIVREDLMFIPASVLAAVRREALEKLDALRLGNYRREERRNGEAGSEVQYPSRCLDFTANVTNRLAERFYRRHGVGEIEKGFELGTAAEGKK